MLKAESSFHVKLAYMFSLVVVTTWSSLAVCSNILCFTAWVCSCTLCMQQAPLCPGCYDLSVCWWSCPDLVSFGVLSFSSGQPLPAHSKEVLLNVQVEFSESYSWKIFLKEQFICEAVWNLENNFRRKKREESALFSCQCFQLRTLRTPCPWFRDRLPSFHRHVIIPFRLFCHQKLSFKCWHTGPLTHTGKTQHFLASCLPRFIFFFLFPINLVNFSCFLSVTMLYDSKDKSPW